MNGRKKERMNELTNHTGHFWCLIARSATALLTAIPRISTHHQPHTHTHTYASCGMERETNFGVVDAVKWECWVLKKGLKWGGV